MMKRGDVAGAGGYAGLSAALRMTGDTDTVTLVEGVQDECVEG